MSVDMCTINAWMRERWWGGSWTRVRLRRSWISDAVRSPDAAVCSALASRADGACWSPSVLWDGARSACRDGGGVPGVAGRRGCGLVVGSGAGGAGRRAGAGEGGGVGGAGAGHGCVAVFAGGGGAAGCGAVGGVGGGVGAAGVAEFGGSVCGVVAGVGARDAGDDGRAVAGECSERVAVAVVAATATLSLADRAEVDPAAGSGVRPVGGQAGRCGGGAGRGGAGRGVGGGADGGGGEESRGSVCVRRRTGWRT